MQFNMQYSPEFLKRIQDARYGRTRAYALAEIFDTTNCEEIVLESIDGNFSGISEFVVLHWWISEFMPSAYWILPAGQIELAAHILLEVSSQEEPDPTEIETVCICHFIDGDLVGYNIVGHLEGLAFCASMPPAVWANGFTDENGNPL